MKLVEVLADNQISKRKQEVFRRISPKGLTHLIASDNVGETVFDLFEEKLSTKEARVQLSNQKQKQESSLSSLMLIDLRLPEEFDKFHIKNGQLISLQSALLLHQPR